MSSNPSLSLVPSKSVQNAPQTPSFSHNLTTSFTSQDSGSRRSGGTGGQRPVASTARSGQALRKQHKGHRRPRLADEDAFAESAAMQSTSSRKGQTSITHLMNFTLPPRPQNHHHSHHFGRNVRKNPTWGIGSGYHAADKARYIHANYRFIVNPNGDYSSQATDADVHLDWNTVLQILASAQSQSANCPICLSTPVVPRMARCGHLFCLPCVIRYMHSSDPAQPTPERKARWKACPICGDSIYISETRPVRWFTGQEAARPDEGDDVVLRLIQRQPGSTLALPRDGAEVLEQGQDMPWYFAAEVMDYARIMKGSEDYMVEEHLREIEELKELEREDELMFGEDNQWTRRAVNSVNEAIERLKGLGNPPNTPSQPVERKTRRPPIEFKTDKDATPDFFDIHQANKAGQSISRSPMPIHSDPSSSGRETSTGPSSHGSCVGTIPNGKARAPSQSSLPVRPGHSMTRPSRPEAPFFFYEALLHHYLAPLDIRSLKAAFGDYALLPSTILPRVEHVSTGHIMDDELRRRAKYLSHLPHGCEVAFLECSWTDVVPAHVLETFSGEIERRRKKNREKAIREEKDRARAEKDEDDRRWATTRRRRPMLAEDGASDVDFRPLPESQLPELPGMSSSPPWTANGAQDGSAFASLASPSSSPAAVKTVWGTRIVPVSQDGIPLDAVEPEAPEGDGWLANWEDDAVQGEASALVTNEQIAEDGLARQAMTGGAGKKRKGKKITLMTTNGRRGA